MQRLWSSSINKALASLELNLYLCGNRYLISYVHIGVL